MISLIPLPYRILAALLLTASLFGFGYYKGSSNERDKQLIEQSKANDAATEKYQKISQELEDAKANQKTIVQTVTKYRDKIVDRPVYRNACLDDDGLRLFNEAIKATDSGKFDAAMPKPGSIK